jgi:hypothetical protein
MKIQGIENRTLGTFKRSRTLGNSYKNKEKKKKLKPMVCRIEPRLVKRYFSRADLILPDCPFKN